LPLIWHICGSADIVSEKEILTLFMIIVFAIAAGVILFFVAGKMGL